MKHILSPKTQHKKLTALALLLPHVPQRHDAVVGTRGEPVAAVLALAVAPVGLGVDVEDEVCVCALPRPHLAEGVALHADDGLVEGGGDHVFVGEGQAGDEVVVLLQTKKGICVCRLTYD